MTKKEDMKIALVHDYIKEYGGAERVLESLHALFPDAPVYTSVYLPTYLGPHKERFSSWQIKTSWAQHLPFKAKLISPLRVLSPLLFKQFDFSGYDVIITSATGAYFPNSLKKRNAKLLCYCHTPPRYLYGYATAREWKKNRVINVLSEAANHFLRMIDFAASKNVDQYIANSEEVKRRIEKFYRRDAVVVYPPVKLSYSSSERSESRSSPRAALGRTINREYFVAGGRLARPKHIDLIIRACQELNVPLKVFGKAFAGYGEELQKLAENNYSSSERSESRSKSGSSSRRSLSRAQSRDSNNIELLGEVTEEEKWELLSGAKAYLFASEDEDFGILPVEAMAAGTPVIAYRSGGVQETVLQSRTGIFFDELTVKSLKQAIKQFNDLNHFSKEACRKRAAEFSEEAFKEKMQNLVTKLSS